MRIIDYYKEEQVSITNTHRRQHARRYWLRAVIETLHERAITNDALPVQKATDLRTVRCLPFWWALSDDELYELRDYLRPYFKRSENRGQPL
ncbi:hypothetical protein [Brevundimonas sp. NPDC058933]|uniref:hypothetical protein n=1 Tax=Brevundimonas sp. NPDC058933 TaxID=3346673 RepID=UPI003BEEE7E8